MFSAVEDYDMEMFDILPRAESASGKSLNRCIYRQLSITMGTTVLGTGMPGVKKREAVFNFWFRLELPLRFRRFGNQKV